MLSLPLPLNGFADPDSNSRENIVDQLGQLYGPFGPSGRYFKLVRANAAVAPYALTLVFDDRDDATNPYDVALGTSSNTIKIAGGGQVEMSGITVPDNGIFLMQVGGKVPVTLDSSAGAVAVGELLMPSNATAARVEKSDKTSILDSNSSVWEALEAMTVAGTVYEAAFLHVVGN